MQNEISNQTRLSDAELLQEVKRLTSLERQATARLIAALGELDARRLYLGEGCSSLFTYCTQVLHLSEHAAYLRIETARAARKVPALLDLLADGSLHLTAISVLAPHLTVDNHAALVASAKHKSKREIEHLVAAVRPQPAVPSTVRKLPTQTPVSLPTAPQPDEPPILLPVIQPTRTAEVKPIAPERYKVQFTASQETCDKLKLAQDLLRHTIPSGDVAAVIDRALTLLVEQLQRTKSAAVDRPRSRDSSPTRSSGRYIPAAVKREVWRRDGGQCAFVGATGRCTEHGFLEYHHRVPFADGGAATVDNLELRCRAHNAFEADRWSGSDLVREVPPTFTASPYALWTPDHVTNHWDNTQGLDRADPTCARSTGTQNSLAQLRYHATAILTRPTYRRVETSRIHPQTGPSNVRQRSQCRSATVFSAEDPTVPIASV